MTSKCTVLIVDDEPAGREVLETMLEREGYDLVFAASGNEALRRALERSPDLILLDVMMPDMDGFEVCRRLRVHPQLREVPVILVTALDDRQSRVSGIESGADDFVSKPVDRLELRARVRTVTRLNRFRKLVVERTKFQWVVEEAEEGYLILDRAQHVLYANPQARLFLGLPEKDGDLIADTFMSIVERQYRCEPSEAWAVWPEGVSSTDKSPRYLVRPETRTTDAFWLGVELMRMESFEADAFLVRIRDVTDLVRAEFHRWSFHTLVRHKLATPMGPLAGALELLEGSDASLAQSEAKELLAIACQSAKRLQDEVMGIVGYLEARDLFRAKDDPGFVRTVQAAVADAAARLDLKTVQVIGAEALADIPLPLSRRAVELVCFELLENATKFHPRRAPLVQVTIEQIMKGILIRVTDDGVTLSPEHLRRVGVPYFQAEKVSTGQVPGMGLGLSTVTLLVAGAGGTVHIRNRDQAPGVTVELLLPVVGSCHAVTEPLAHVRS